MEQDKLAKAAAEARRFLERVADLRKAEKVERWSHPKESGAVRRASLDLTRALAEYRRPAP